MEKIEENAKLPKGVTADIREFETIFAHLEKGEAVTKRQREGYNLWSDVDRMRGRKRSDFLKEHSLEGLSTADKISKVKQILNKLGDKSIQDRRCQRETQR